MGFFDIQYKRHGKLDLTGFVTPDNVIWVPPEYWRKIIADHSQSEVIDAICSVHDDYGVLNPLLANRGIKSALTAFNKLKAYDTRRSIHLTSSPVFTRQEYRHALDLNCFLQAPSSYNDASDFFHRHNRMLAGHVNFNAPLEAWNDLRKRKLILKSLFSLKQPSLSVNTIEASFGLRHYIAGQFRVAMAKTIYELFGARDVFDPSAGWGDRFAGFSAASGTASYIGTDPNENLHEGYWAQGRSYQTGKAYKFLCEGAEDVDLDGYTFDTIFTSPPYFNTEKYSDHDAQSWKRYSEVEDWQNSFLNRMLSRAWKRLRVGGVLVINIADLGTRGKLLPICDPMNDYISTLPNASYVGGLGMRMQARPSTGIQENEQGKTIFIEPVWVWTKGPTRSLASFIDAHSRRHT